MELSTLYDTAMAKLLVTGHSFVRRLKEYLGGKGLRLERQFSSTVIRGFGGMRLASLRQHLVYVKREKPTVIVVDIGTNDNVADVLSTTSSERSGFRYTTVCGT